MLLTSRRQGDKERLQTESGVGQGTLGNKHGGKIVNFSKYFSVPISLKSQ